MNYESTSHPLEQRSLTPTVELVCFQNNVFDACCGCLCLIGVEKRFHKKFFFYVFKECLDLTPSPLALLYLTDSPLVLSRLIQNGATCTLKETSAELVKENLMIIFSRRLVERFQGHVLFSFKLIRILTNCTLCLLIFILYSEILRCPLSGVNLYFNVYI